jgi:hypothetical protein
MRWSPAPLTVFASGSGRCRWDSCCKLEVQLDMLVRRLAPELLGQLGIGPVVAGQIITSWSHHGRIRSEAAFARLAGAAPIELLGDHHPAPTEQVWRPTAQPRAQHHRAGRMRQDSVTKDYVQRRLAQGKTIRDIKRCLKRYIARQLFRQLEALSSTT